MVDKIKETVHAIKTLELLNTETFVLTHNRFNTCMVLIFSDLNKAQSYKMPCRVGSRDELDMVMSFSYLNVFNPNEHTEDYHVRKPTDENFLFEIEDKKIFMWEKKYLVLKQMMKLKNIFQNSVLTMSNSHMLMVRTTFTNCYIENRFLFKNMKLQY